MKPIEAWWNEHIRDVQVAEHALRGGYGHRWSKCLILPGLTTADWDALMELVRAAGDCSFGPVLDLPPAIIAAAREGK